jgi:hypothetical protein
MLQRMLAAHSHIATAPEPWVLLPYLFSLRPEGIYADYGHHTAVKAIEGLCERLDGGRTAYREAVRGMVEGLYDQLSEVGCSYFLDKTPRYNLAVDELLETFPEAPIIILWRNPLAVVGSIVDTWLQGQWQPYHHKVDLFDGFERLLAAYERQPARFLTIRYEDLVADPVGRARALLSELGLGWEEATVQAFDRVRLGGTVGDQRGPALYQGVSRLSLERWKPILASPVRKLWCRRYLRWLGDRRLALMGYRLEDLEQQLESVTPAWRGVPADLAMTVKGIAWSLVEPDILRHKLSLLPEWRRLHSHT